MSASPTGEVAAGAAVAAVAAPAAAGSASRCASIQRSRVMSSVPTNASRLPAHTRLRGQAGKHNGRLGQFGVLAGGASADSDAQARAGRQARAGHRRGREAFPTPAGRPAGQGGQHRSEQDGGLDEEGGARGGGQLQPGRLRQRACGVVQPAAGRRRRVYILCVLPVVVCPAARQPPLAGEESRG